MGNPDITPMDIECYGCIGCAACVLCTATAALIPSGTTIEFKFIKKDALGNITWESGSNRTVTSSSNPCGVVDTEVYTWRN